MTSARKTYDAFAGSYDDFTNSYLNDRWTATLVRRARRCGLAGHRLLDVGCGTGKSFIPMLERGWKVTATDISPAMLDIAERKVGESATLIQADVRSLPTLGTFDLVWALDDTLNYMLSVRDLNEAIHRMACNLGPDGVLLFDVNTLLTYRTFFSTDSIVDYGGRTFRVRGLEKRSVVEAGAVCRASFEVDDGSMATHIHCQRHFTDQQVRAAIARAGLACCEVSGDANGELDDWVDESRHSKAIYICVSLGDGTS